MGRECEIQSREAWRVGGGGGQRRPRNSQVAHGTHLLGDRVDQPDIEVLLRADACRRGDPTGVRGRGAPLLHRSPSMVVPRLSCHGDRDPPNPQPQLNLLQPCSPSRAVPASVYVSSTAHACPTGSPLL